MKLHILVFICLICVCMLSMCVDVHVHVGACVTCISTHMQKSEDNLRRCSSSAFHLVYEADSLIDLELKQVS